MPNYIYSTLTNDQLYVTWQKNETARIAMPEHKVLIKGGANRATKSLVTPHGTVTEVSDLDMDHLKDNEVFKRHVKGGFIKVDDKKVDIEVAAAKDMDLADDSAPITPNTFGDANEGDAKPKEDKPVNRAKKLIGRVSGLGDERE